MLKPKEIAYTKTIRINGQPFPNPFKLNEVKKLRAWLKKTKNKFPYTTWKVEEWEEEKQLCVRSTI